MRRVELSARGSCRGQQAAGNPASRRDRHGAGHRSGEGDPARTRRRRRESPADPPSRPLLPSATGGRSRRSNTVGCLSDPDAIDAGSHADLKTMRERSPVSISVRKIVRACSSSNARSTRPTSTGWRIRQRRNAANDHTATSQAGMKSGEWVCGGGPQGGHPRRKRPAAGALANAKGQVDAASWPRGGASSRRPRRTANPIVTTKTAFQ